MKGKLLPILSVCWMGCVGSLVAATFLQRFLPEWWQTHSFYQSGWFFAIWSFLFLLAFVSSLLWAKMKKNSAPLVVHSGLLLILAGAFATLLTEKERHFVLYENKTQLVENNLLIALKDCDIDSYKIILEIKNGSESSLKELSPNHIAKESGWRFYVLGIAASQKTASVKAVYNPVGTALTYLGMGIVLVAWAFAIFRKRKKKPRVDLKLTIFIVLIFSFLAPATAQRTLSPKSAEEWGSVAILYQGRIVPFETFCNDFAREISGGTSVGEFSSVQLTMGWLLFPEDWFSVPFVKVPRELQPDISGKKYAAPADFFTTSGNFKLDENTENRSEQKVLRQFGLLQQMRSGELLKLYPIGNQWFSPTEMEVTKENRWYVETFSLLRQSIEMGDEVQTKLLCDKVRQFQNQRVQQPWRLRWEQRYNHYVRWNGACAGLLFLFFVFKLLNNNLLDTISRWGVLTLAAYLTLQFVLRWILAQHLPLGNGYETLLFLTLLFLFASVFFQKNAPTLSASTDLLAGVTLIVSTFSFNNQSITKIQPILDSPLLGIHVVVVMASYAGLALTVALSASALFSRKKDKSRFMKTTAYSRQVLDVSVWLLAFGIALGSVWANISWGSYWSWDPKEVWALITLMVYLPAAQERFFTRFENHTFYNGYAVIAFICVLMTYFGVNWFFGGMHSY